MFLILHETICCGYSLEPLGKALLMSTHNIRFHEETRKRVCEHPLLSGAMIFLNYFLFIWAVQVGVIITLYLICMPFAIRAKCDSWIAFGNPVVPPDGRSTAVMDFQSASRVVYGVPSGAKTDSKDMQPSASPKSIILKFRNMAIQPSASQKKHHLKLRNIVWPCKCRVIELTYFLEHIKLL